MPKRIAICCDGTNNQFDGEHTNVIRAYKVMRHHNQQLCFYDPGVGTMPEPWETSKLGKRWSMLKGLAFGSGFLQNIEDSYRFLMSNYQPNDLIFLFGFSRGAFTARALAGMLNSVGLLRPGSENLIPYAQRYWQKDFGPDSPGGRLCAEFKQTLARECPIHFIGVWDTVSSVGFINQFRTFPHTFTNRFVSHVRHAVSIDERRCCFRQNLMAASFEGQDVRNAWFPGVHSDIGGGYPADEVGLAKTSFEWVMQESMRLGLEIDPEAYERELRQVGSPPDPAGLLHKSLKGGWWLVELIPTRRYSSEDKKHHWHLFEINKPRNVVRDANKPHVYLHSSTLGRLRQCPDYRPPNVPHDERSLRATFKIES